MTKLITKSIVLFSSLAGLAMSQVVMATCPPPIACQVEAHVIDQDPNGLNVRQYPGTQSKVLGTLSHNTEVKVLAYQKIHQGDRTNAWMLVSPISSNQKQFNGNGWVSASLLGLYTKGYDLQSVPIYSEPSKENKSSHVVGNLPSDSLVTLSKCEGKWSHVKAKNLTDDLDIEGWLEPNQQCRSPYTSCS